MNIKNKLASVVTHVKNNQIPYTIATTAAVSVGVACYVEKKYLDSRQLVDLGKSAAKMRETGKGLYFDLKGGGTAVMILEEFLDSPLDRV